MNVSKSTAFKPKIKEKHTFFKNSSTHTKIQGYSSTFKSGFDIQGLSRNSRSGADPDYLYICIAEINAMMMRSSHLTVCVVVVHISTVRDGFLNLVAHGAQVTILFQCPKLTGPLNCLPYPECSYCSWFLQRICMYTCMQVQLVCQN